MGETDRILTKTYEAGEIIISEGDRGKDVYLIITGSAEIYKTVNGNRQLLNTITSGEIFGEMGLLTNEPRYATVVAAEQTRLIVIQDKAFHSALLNDRLPIIKPLARQLVMRYKEAEENNRINLKRIEHLESELACARERLLAHELTGRP